MAQPVEYDNGHGVSDESDVVSLWPADNPQVRAGKYRVAGMQNQTLSSTRCLLYSQFCCRNSWLACY